MRKALLLLSMLSMGFVPATAKSDTGDSYNYKYAEISTKVLKETIGFLSLHVGGGGRNEIETYALVNGKFDPLAKLRPGTDAKALSGFFCSLDEQEPISCTYPVIKQRGRFLLIVIDPTKNTRNWVNMDQLKKEFVSIRFFIFDAPKQKEGYPVDVFFANPDGSIYLYESPVSTSAKKKVSERDNPFSCIPLLVAYKNGFVQLESQDDPNTETNEKRIEGWVKLRDSQGRLTLWPFLLCCFD